MKQFWIQILTNYLPDNEWMRYALRYSRNVVHKIIYSIIKCFAHIKVTQIVNYLFIRFKFVLWEFLFEFNELCCQFEQIDLLF